MPTRYEGSKQNGERGPQSGAPLREFLRSEPPLQGGNGAGVRPYLETNTLFLVRLTEHVDVLTDVGEHPFLRHLNVGAKRRIRRIHYVEQKGSVQRFVESRPE